MKLWITTSTLLAILCILSACGNDIKVRDDFELRPLNKAPKEIQKAAEAVVQIRTNSGTGTGFFVGNHLITNYHVLSEKECALEGCHITLRWNYQPGSEPGEGKVFVVPVAANPEADAVFFEAWNSEKKAYRIQPPHTLKFSNHSLANYPTKESIYTVGHPNGLLKKWAEGHLANVGAVFFFSNTYTLGGQSGSPYLDRAGDVIGIHHRSRREKDTGIQTIGTVATKLQDILNSKSASHYLSLDSEFTDEQTLSHEEMFYNAPEAKKTAVESSILSLLTKSCDKGLSNPVKSLEELDTTMGPCRIANHWITEKIAAGEADTAQLRESWLARYELAFERYQDYPSSPFNWLVSRSVRLYPSKKDGRQGQMAILQKHLDAHSPPLNFDVAYALFSLTEHEPPTYQGVSLVDYTLNFKDVPLYQLQASQIAYALYRLYAFPIHRARTQEALNALLNDSKIDMASYLETEAVVYHLGLLSD